jgi:hypothetical protein
MLANSESMMHSLARDGSSLWSPTVQPLSPPSDTETTRVLLHQLNNQLALAMGYAELLAMDPRLPEPLQAMVQEALRGAEEAALSARQIQALTRASGDQPRRG